MYPTSDFILPAASLTAQSNTATSAAIAVSTTPAIINKRPRYAPHLTELPERSHLNNRSHTDTASIHGSAKTTYPTRQTRSLASSTPVHPKHSTAKLDLSGASPFVTRVDLPTHEDIDHGEDSSQDVPRLAGAQRKLTRRLVETRDDADADADATNTTATTTATAASGPAAQHKIRGSDPDLTSAALLPTTTNRRGISETDSMEDDMAHDDADAGLGESDLSMTQMDGKGNLGTPKHLRDVSESMQAKRSLTTARKRQVKMLDIQQGQTSRASTRATAKNKRIFDTLDTNEASLASDRPYAGNVSKRLRGISDTSKLTDENGQVVNIATAALTGQPTQNKSLHLASPSTIDLLTKAGAQTFAIGQLSSSKPQLARVIAVLESGAKYSLVTLGKKASRAITATLKQIVLDSQMIAEFAAPQTAEIEQSSGLGMGTASMSSTATVTSASVNASVYAGADGGATDTISMAITTSLGSGPTAASVVGSIGNTRSSSFDTKHIRQLSANSGIVAVPAHASGLLKGLQFVLSFSIANETETDSQQQLQQHLQLQHNKPIESPWMTNKEFVQKHIEAMGGV
eukprot:jgi/Hompol1/6164/HPOL_004852-RA